MNLTYITVSLAEGRWKPTQKRFTRKREGKKSKTVYQHTTGKEFCGKGKENGGTAEGKLREMQFVFKIRKVSMNLYVNWNNLVETNNWWYRSEREELLSNIRE